MERGVAARSDFVVPLGDDAYRTLNPWNVLGWIFYYHWWGVAAEAYHLSIKGTIAAGVD